MDPSREQHNPEMASQTLESMLVCTKSQQDKKPRPLEQALKCPRCDSTNTKFCYYNNYSLTQPRYFCKSCRRYWTKGGTLRNVPVGGGCRKNKRSSSSKRGQDQAISSPNPLFTGLSYDSDISLAIARLQKQTVGHMGFDEHDLSILGNPINVDAIGSIHDVVNPSGVGHGVFDALRGGFLETPNGYQNLYYGNMGHFENHGLSLGISGSIELASMGYDQEMGGGIETTTTITATTVTTVKQEMCNPREGENRVLMGFPWQYGGEGNMVDFETPRQSWNGFGSSSWHGLLNSPLM